MGKGSITVCVRMPVPVRQTGTRTGRHRNPKHIMSLAPFIYLPCEVLLHWSHSQSTYVIPAKPVLDLIGERESIFIKCYIYGFRIK